MRSAASLRSSLPVRSNSWEILFHFSSRLNWLFGHTLSTISQEISYSCSLLDTLKGLSRISYKARSTLTIKISLGRTRKHSWMTGDLIFRFGQWFSLRRPHGYGRYASSAKTYRSDTFTYHRSWDPKHGCNTWYSVSIWVCLRVWVPAQGMSSFIRGTLPTRSSELSHTLNTFTLISSMNMYRVITEQCVRPRIAQHHVRMRVFGCSW